MPNGRGIQKETFVEADEHTRIALTFDLLDEIREHQCKQIAICNIRFGKLEKRKKFDTSLSAAIGGFAAIIVKKLWS